MNHNEKIVGESPEMNKKAVALASAALIAGLAGSMSEAQAAMITVKVHGIILSSYADFSTGGKTTIGLLDENEDIMTQFGDLYVNADPITDLGTPQGGWIGDKVYNLVDNSFAGTLSSYIDWESYNGGFSGTLTGKIGGELVLSPYATKDAATFLNLKDVTYSYDDGVSPVPLPPSAYLFGTGLLGVAAATRKKKVEQA